MRMEQSLELDVILEEMAQYCSFSLGKETLLTERPSFHPLEIDLKLARIKEALAACISYGPMPFLGIHDLRQPLLELQKGRTLRANDLNQVAQLIHGTKEIITYTKGIEGKKEALFDVVDTLRVHEKLAEEIHQCIDAYGEVKDSASSTLKQIRKELLGIDGVIAAAANSFIAKHKDQVVDQIITERNARVVILVKAQDKNTFGGYVYGDSASGQASYVEPKELIGPNNRKQELLLQEQDEIARILRHLSNEVEEVAEELIANIETIALLDALFAKAIWGTQHDGIVATITKERKFAIKKARHPLIDPKKVIANDYQLGPAQQMLLITGPNTGGKTVSLKIIGLFVLMTYCGMPIPCEEAIFPYFDQIFVDIGDGQSVVSSLSSFSAHIQKLAEILNQASPSSLILLDEIGSGTDPKEGESIAIAVLNELRDRKAMTIATTHYSRLKAYGKRHEDILLASVQFDMEQLMPTYKYLEGITGQSNALEVAKRYGLPSSIIKYAQFLKNQAKSEEDELIDRLEAQLNKNQQLQEQLEQKEASLKEKEAELKKKENQLLRQKERLQEQIEEEKEHILEDARQEAEEILADMRQMKNNAKYHEVLSVANRLEKEEKVEEEDAYTFQVGDVVELKQSNQIARIVELRKKGVVIDLHGREMVVKYNQIYPSAKVLPKEKPTTNVAISTGNPFATMPLECNLIGLYVEEAMEVLQDYLAEAKIHKLKSFRVIHGDGSGALRKAVHACLSKDASIDSFRIGMPQEGGTGATVVTMKE